MPFFPGDPGAQIAPYKQISRGDIANISELSLGSHTGTHVDAPHHFADGQMTVDRLPLDVLMGPARVVEVVGVSSVSRDHLEQAGIEGVTRLLLKTDNSRLWSLPDFTEGYVSLDGEAARYLVETGVRLVGIDYLSVERFRSKSYPVHNALLGVGVIVLEGINLEVVDPGNYDLVCLPLKIRDGDGAPARAILIET